LRTEVLVIGGGITGAGVARDLAMRGAQVALFEKTDFSGGATGRSHGMLHGGGRYAVKDPGSAKECARESQVLRRIASYCVEDTGGLFVGLDEGDLDYMGSFLEGCRKTGVLAERIDLREAFQREPRLSPETKVAISVADAYVDPFFLTQGNIDDARDIGVLARNYCQVVSIERFGERVERVVFRDLRNGNEESIAPEVVVNAAGAWANELAGFAGLNIPQRMDKGSMVVMNGRMVNGLVNRLRKPSDGDIIVPSHSSSIIGTTSIQVSSPEECWATSEEVEKLIREASLMVPAIGDGRAVRAYAGIRPLPEVLTDGREISRAFKLLDHANEGLENMVSIIGGKLTTYRLMAEKVSDLVMSKLGRKVPCRTDKEEIRPPAGSLKPGGTYDFHWGRISRKYGSRADEVLRACQARPRGREMLCSCEHVLRGEAEFFCDGGDVNELSDLMRRTRAGMGYCQAGLCLHGMASVLTDYLYQGPLEMLEDFKKERWKGVRPVLFGDQLRQEMFKLYLDASLALHGGGESPEKE
jgi:glycerol-3-phosphate dehydrogenase